VSGVEDVPAVNALQDQYSLMPLSAYLGQTAPETVPAPDFPPYDPEKADSIEFISYFNFLMGQMEPGPDERPLLEKWSQIGVKPGAAFDPDALAPEIKEAVAEGVTAALEKIKAESLRVGRNVNNWTLFGEGFGYRSMVGGKDLLRAAANMVGIYGNNPEEAYNFTGAKDSDGEPLDASKHNYVIHFKTPPPVKAFWSITMYKLPTPLFIANPIKRYSIGNRTPGFTPNEDGSVTIYMQHESPGADKESNWLPTAGNSTTWRRTRQRLETWRQRCRTRCRKWPSAGTQKPANMVFCPWLQVTYNAGMFPVRLSPGPGSDMFTIRTVRRFPSPPCPGSITTRTALRRNCSFQRAALRGS